jgi:enolase-phosphatase E1
MNGVLLDIEGTTTPIAYVYGVLFPYVQNRLSTFEVSEDIVKALKLEHAQETDCPTWEGPVPYIKWLMHHDRKSTALKELQGRIWQDGYRRGDLHGDVFPDVAPALEAWWRWNVDIRIFSSGSVLAQQLLFSTTAAGDLTRFIRGYFDTTTGPKTSPSSYTVIAEAFAKPPGEILFVSDVVSELDAARVAGLRTLLCQRPGNRPQPESSHQTIISFDQIVLDRSLQPE